MHTDRLLTFPHLWFLLYSGFPNTLLPTLLYYYLLYNYLPYHYYAITIYLSFTSQRLLRLRF
jgi:hypothetical protein